MAQLLQQSGHPAHNPTPALQWPRLVIHSISLSDKYVYTSTTKTSAMTTSHWLHRIVLYGYPFSTRLVWMGDCIMMKHYNLVTNQAVISHKTVLKWKRCRVCSQHKSYDAQDVWCHLFMLVASPNIVLITHYARASWNTHARTHARTRNYVTHLSRCSIDFPTRAKEAANSDWTRPSVDAFRVRLAGRSTCTL